MAIFQPDTNLMTQLQGYRSQRGLTSGQRLSTPEWRGIVEGYNSSQYRNALEMAKIAEQRRQQATQIQAQKDMMDQRMQGSELKGAGQLGGGLYSGYKMGQDVGLWGNKPPTYAPGQADASSANLGTIGQPATPVNPYMPNKTIGSDLNLFSSGGMGAPPPPIEANPALSSTVTSGLSPLEGYGAGVYPLANAPEILSPTGTLAGTGLGESLSGLAGTAPGVGVLAPEALGMGTEAVGAGLGAAAEGTAAGASAAAPAAAGASMLGPIGMGVGGAMLLASLLGFGPEEWF